MHNLEAGKLTSDWWKNFWQFAPNLKDALYEGTFGAFKNDANVYNPVLWTMKLELWGSFLVFGSLLIIGKLRNRWVLYGVLVLLLWRTYYPAFVLGVAACDYYFNRPEGAVRRALERGWWVAVLAAALLIGSYPITELHGTVWANVPGFWPVQAHTLAAIGIVVAILSARGLQRALSSRTGRFLGRISFPLYLLHFLVLGSYTSYLFVHLSHQMSLKAAMLVAVLPTLAICVSAAYVYAKFVDEPAIRFSGWMFSRFFGGKAPEKRADLMADSDPAPVHGVATARNS
jgi:peptidoglycan/LPS O-acetylase OafA/YrhL